MNVRQIFDQRRPVLERCAVDFGGSKTIINGTKFGSAILAAANFSGAQFQVNGGAAPDFTKALLQGATFDADANLVNAVLLNAFVENPGRVLSRDRLLDMTRAPGTDVNDRSIDLAVSRLRGKLGRDAEHAPLIRTLRGEGYLFDAQVQG